MATPNEAAIMASIGKFTRRSDPPEHTRLDDPTQFEIEDLAKRFKADRFVITVDTNIGGPIENEYRVGKPIAQSGLRFHRRPAQTFHDEPVLLHKSMVVPTIVYADLIQEGDAVVIPSDSANNNIHTWKSLNLESLSRCVILTTQITGCTFAMGISGTILYLGHARPGNNISGVQLASKIAKGAIFASLPSSLLAKNIFLIRPVDGSAAITGNHLGYPGVNSVNILGMAFSGRVFFIVQKCDSTLSVVEVDLVYYDAEAPQPEWKQQRM